MRRTRQIELETGRFGFLRPTPLGRFRWKRKGATISGGLRVLAAVDAADTLSALQNACDGCEIVADVNDGWEMLRAVERCAPDLILAELEMRGLDGIEATARLIRLHPDMRVIIIARDDPRELIEEAFEAGARGYVLKDELARDLALAVKAVIAGGRFVSQSS
jgi:DNA-binding NarL/FixJ family response regulator